MFILPFSFLWFFRSWISLQSSSSKSSTDLKLVQTIVCWFKFCMKPFETAWTPDTPSQTCTMLFCLSLSCPVSAPLWPRNPTIFSHRGWCSLLKWKPVTSVMMKYKVALSFGKIKQNHLQHICCTVICFNAYCVWKKDVSVCVL